MCRLKEFEKIFKELLKMPACIDRDLRLADLMVAMEKSNEWIKKDEDMMKLYWEVADSRLM